MRVQTLQRWGIKPQSVATVLLQEEADAIAVTSCPRLEAEIAEGRFEAELAAVRGEIKTQV